MQSATLSPRHGRSRACWHTVIALLAWLPVSACVRAPVGVYADSSGTTRYEFRPDGEVYVSVLGTTVTGAYEANRERILINGPQGTVVLLRKADRLQGPMGLELLFQPDVRGELER